MKKKRISVKNMVILLGILLIGVCAALPHFIWVVERAYAGAGLSALVQVNVAENYYYLQHNVFTSDWQELDKSFPPNLPGKFAPVSALQTKRFFQVEGTEEGFDFELHLQSDLSGGFVMAKREGLVSYTLQESFPYPYFSCEGSNKLGQWFCRKFMVYTDDIMLKPQAGKNKESSSENELPEK